MAGLGLVLGGALHGIGQGIVADAQERRKIALENLRSQNTRAEATHAGEITRQNNTHYGNVQKDVNDNEAKNQNWLDSERTVRKTNADITLKGVDAKIDKDFAAYKESLARETARVLSKLSIEEKKAIAQFNVTHIREGSDGKIYGITEGGKTIDLGISAPPKDASDQPLLNRGGNASPPANRPPLDDPKYNK